MKTKNCSLLLSLVSLFALATPALTVGQSVQVRAPEWTTKPVELRASNTNESSAVSDVLREVRANKHQGYDRVVFEFSGKSVPKSEVRYAKPPFNLGESDEIVKVAGNSFLEVVFAPAYAHDIESGQVSVKEPYKLLRLPTVREVKRVYDHEGQVIYVLGLAARKSFRVHTLTNPSRLVVDVKH